MTELAVAMPSSQSPQSQEANGNRRDPYLFQTTTHVYYALSRALLRGQSPETIESEDGKTLFQYGRRRGITVELVVMIFRLSGFSKLRPTQSLSVHSSAAVEVSDGLAFEAGLLLCASLPIGHNLLSRLRKIQLTTVSHDQGWVKDRDAGNWSWFDLVVYTPYVDDDEDWKGFGVKDGRERRESRLLRERIEDEVSPWVTDFPTTPTEQARQKQFRIKLSTHPFDTSLPAGAALRWRSHTNVLANSTFHRLQGTVFDEDAEVWKHLEEGDIVAVWACVQFPGWENIAKSGKILFWERFDPTGLTTSI